MNHNFGRDLLALDRLLTIQLRYIGLLGPKKNAALSCWHGSVNIGCSIFTPA
jgi:xanthine/CO dehydrogenase XdhC/CoxF family maturation factor